MSSVLESIARAPFIPTVFPISADALCRYIEVLHEEGYSALEILSRPPEEALSVVRAINARPERKRIYLGIGTILTETAARRAAELRPDFLVSPAFSRKVLRVAAEARIPYIPAVRTFQDVQDVLDAFEEEHLPVRVLKLCPVEGLTIAYVNMLGGCFPGIMYCPTGEVTMDKIPYWKSSPAIAAPMESKFVAKEDILAGDADKIRGRLREIARLAKAGA
jgi:2-dehydro-3-deoxyphosphogluconate aldolase / (4S)-4-hydroxy-2-oxoglutarate aldolase